MVVCMNGTTVREGSGGATCGEWRPGAVARGGRCRERRRTRKETQWFSARRGGKLTGLVVGRRLFRSSPDDYDGIGLDLIFVFQNKVNLVVCL